MLIGAVVLLVVAAGLGVVYWPLSLVVIPFLIALLGFFRDPHRKITGRQDAMVSPADGKVSDITELTNDPLLGGPCIRVGIFLSVFNVHINRCPCDGKVAGVVYKEGKFINALNHAAASSDNESNTVLINDVAGKHPVAVVKQIVGLIARRIVCSVKPGQAVARGQRIGMIKFGSRTELYIPLNLKPQVQVVVGQAVRGGADIIALLGVPIPATMPLDEEFEVLVRRETPA